jgi:group I intron endonuclease
MLIYKAINKINGKIYIGVTASTVLARIQQHYKINKYLFGKALRKYGLQSFEFSVIDSALLKEIAFEKEMYWIKSYNSKAPNGYNLTNGGDGRKGHPITEETRDKLRRSHLGHVHSKDHKDKISKSMKGRSFSDVHKQNLSKSMRGNKNGEGKRGR